MYYSLLAFFVCEACVIIKRSELFVSSTSACNQAWFGDKDLDSIKCSVFYRVVQQTIETDKTPEQRICVTFQTIIACIKENLSDRQDSFVL